LKDACFENIQVLDHDKDSYALRLCNFLFVNVNHFFAHGGPLLEIYANLPNFQQGNSVFDDMFCEILYDLTVDYTAGPYPFFIHRNDSVGTTWTNLNQFRRIQINNPTGQTDTDYRTVTFWALYYSTFSDLNIEGVASTVNASQIGGCHSVLFDSLFVWAQASNCTWDVAAGNSHLTFANARIEGHVIDGNLNDTWISPFIAGDIQTGSEAQFINLEGNSGFDEIASGTSSETISARYLGAYSFPIITIADSDSLAAGESLKVESIDSGANTFVVKCIDELNANATISFFWQITTYNP